MRRESKRRPADYGTALKRKSQSIFYTRNSSLFQGFRKDLLPTPQVYYQNEDLRLCGKGEWRSALCVFHLDTNPSLRININSGGFRCMACGVRGSDVLAFHMRRYGYSFSQAVQALGAWGAKL